jgi:ethanolaminephosphotransferase
VGTLLHLISLSSSSFIEEEHQVWYFLWLTFAVVILYELCCALFSKKPLVSIYKIHSIEKPKSGRLLLNWLGLLFLHRVLRKWNQTGDKWASLPDIGDWLIQQEQKTYLSVVLLLGNLHFLIFCSKI